jgi:hypothetical protein
LHQGLKHLGRQLHRHRAAAGLTLYRADAGTGLARIAAA